MLIRLCELTGYDAALYSAATSYYQQQQAAKVKVGGVGIKAKTKMPPKQPQLHYCDVCKISCAGPQVGTSIVKHVLDCVLKINCDKKLYVTIINECNLDKATCTKELWKKVKKMI